MLSVFCENCWGEDPNWLIVDSKLTAINTEIPTTFSAPSPPPYPTHPVAPLSFIAGGLNCFIWDVEIEDTICQFIIVVTMKY